jgi:hypothetical protein
MIFLQPSWIIGFVFAWCFFMGGQMEARHKGGRNPGPVWALISIAVTAVVTQLLGGGVFLVILGQVVAFAGITAWRVIFDK